MIVYLATSKGKADGVTYATVVCETATVAISVVDEWMKEGGDAYEYAITPKIVVRG